MGWAELAAAPPQLGWEGVSPLQAKGQEAMEEPLSAESQDSHAALQTQRRLLWSPLR